MKQDVTRFSFPSPLLIALYRLAKWGVVAAVTAVYFSCYRWNFLFGIIMLAAFAYCFSGVASLIINFVVYILSKPVVLAQNEDIIANGIPQNVKAVFFRPIFAKSNSEMDTVLSSMRQDIINNNEENRNLKFVVIDNTRDEDVKKYTRERIKEMQQEFGDDVVYYFHRNVKCDFFKKVGIYQDALMFLYEGWTRPSHYISDRWQQWAGETRNPNEPLWDVILGNISALGIEGSIEDVIGGKEVSVDKDSRVSLAFVSDADNVWPKGEVRKMIGKMMHPDNEHITIFQPSIELSNPNENWYIKLTSIAREMYGFDMVARWRVYRFSPFFGKGAMHVANYVREVVRAEVLHPGKAASHDFQEALFAWSVLVEDVYILEKTFSNKMAELTRGAAWQWGDWETVQQYLFKKCEAGRQQHLWVLLRNLIGTVVYNIWVIGTVLAWYLPVLADVERGNLLMTLFAFIILIGLVTAKVLSPVVNMYKPRAFTSGMEVERTPVQIACIAIVESFVAMLIHVQDLVYRPMAFGQNLLKQYTGVSYEWKSGAMAEMETSDSSLVQTYRILSVSSIIGVILFLFSVIGIFPPLITIFMLPYTLSFLFGPAVIYVTSKKIPSYIEGRF